MKNKNFIGAMLFAIAIFSALSFSWPYYKNVQIYKDQVKIRQDTVQERNAIVAHINQLAAELRKKEADLERFSLTIPSDKSIPELITIIEDISLKSKVQVPNINIQPSEQTVEFPGIAVLNLDMNMRGGYQDILDALSRIQSSLRIIDVDTISILPESGPADALNVQVTGSVYFLGSVNGVLSK